MLFTVKRNPIVASSKGLHLQNEIQNFVKNKSSVIARVFGGRSVSFAKYLEANQGRKADRLRFLPCGVELIRKVGADYPKQSYRDKRKCDCWELVGIAPNGDKFKVHIREEVDGQKNRRLYLISCYPTKK